LVIFLASWQVMTVAMMLPSSMPVVSMMAYASKRQRHPWAIQGAFLGGYAVIWTAFAFTAFLVDTPVHQLVNHWGWLYTHSWLIGAVTFAIAGGFQFSLLKEHCLKQCRYTSKEALELHNVVLCSGYFRPLSSTCTL